MSRSRRIISEAPLETQDDLESAAADFGWRMMLREQTAQS